MKRIKLFAVCCGMLLAGIVSTTKTTAQVIDPGGHSIGIICVGDQSKCMTMMKEGKLILIYGEAQIIL